MSTSLFIRSTLTVLLPLLVACGGIEDPHHRPEEPLHSEEQPCWGAPGSPGAPGGNGGRITVYFGALHQTASATLDAALDVIGGHGGTPGEHGAPVPPDAPEAPLGADGIDGSDTALARPELTVDLSGIAPDDALFVNAGDIYLKTKMLQGPLRVHRMVVAPGVNLELSGNWIIEADEVLISPGASIIISDRGDRTKDVFGSAVGHQGGNLMLRARTLELYGDIIAAGRDGAPGEAGGDGGEVLIEAESLTLGQGAGIHAGGGRGGQGADGQACR